MNISDMGQISVRPTYITWTKSNPNDLDRLNDLTWLQQCILGPFPGGLTSDYYIMFDCFIIE